MKTISPWLRLALAGVLLVEAGYAGDPQPEMTFYSDNPDGTSSFSPDGQTVLIGNGLWSVLTGELLQQLMRDYGGGRTAITSDGTMAAMETHTNGIALWDLTRRPEIRTFAYPVINANGFALSPDGKYIAVTADKTVWLYALDPDSLVWSVELPPPQSYGGVHSPVFSSDGTALAVCRYSDVVVLQADSGDTASQFEVGSGVHRVAFSPNGKLLAAVSASSRSCHVWDLMTGQSLYDSWGWGADVTFSPDGRFVLVGGYGWTRPSGDFFYVPSRIVSLATGAEVRLLPPAKSVAWSPDGKHVMLDFSAVSTLWDVRNVLADLRIVTSQSGLEARWDMGALQFSPTANGPWTDLPVASPMPLSAVGERGFFRVKIEQ